MENIYLLEDQIKQMPLSEVLQLRGAARILRQHVEGNLREYISSRFPDILTVPYKKAVEQIRTNEQALINEIERRGNEKKHPALESARDVINENYAEARRAVGDMDGIIG